LRNFGVPYPLRWITELSPPARPASSRSKYC
jgi:hypothetical protein